MWRIWCYALGKKEGRDKNDADRIAIIRTLIMVQLIITNFFIIAGNVKSLFFHNTQGVGLPTSGVICDGKVHTDTNTCPSLR